MDIIEGSNLSGGLDRGAARSQRLDISTNNFLEMAGDFLDGPIPPGNF